MLLLEEDQWDLIYKVYIGYGGLHYFFDSCVKAYTYGLGIFSEKCTLWYFLHHIMTVVTCKQMMMLDHYPWFVAFPISYHCIIVAFPKWPYNNYVYGFALCCFVFGLSC